MHICGGGTNATLIAVPILFSFEWYLKADEVDERADACIKNKAQLFVPQIISTAHLYPMRDARSCMHDIILLFPERAPARMGICDPSPTTLFGT